MTVRALHRRPRGTDELVVRGARAGEESTIAAMSSPFVTRDLLVGRDRAQLADHLDEFVVATCGGRLIGCVGLAPCRHELVLYNLCVAEEMQGRGVGLRLLACADEYAAQHGFGALLASSCHSGAWFLRQDFSEIDRDRAPGEWPAALRRGRQSRLYRRATVVPGRTQKEPA
jgi:amino-acid N-acetyltransferase